MEYISPRYFYEHYKMPDISYEQIFIGFVDR